MNFSSMLVRLQTKLNLPNLAEEILLLPPQPHHSLAETQEINLLVGYSNSRNSQLALDLTLCIALQTRLVVSHPVTVQVVYVAEETTQDPASCWLPTKQNRKIVARSQAGNTAVLDRTLVDEQQMLKTKLLNNRVANKHTHKTDMVLTKALTKAEQFEKADSILWQARSLAEEWRGSLKTHLRFGNIAEELQYVAQAEKANLLILGCESKCHPLITDLGRDFPCPILGIPQALIDEL